MAVLCRLARGLAQGHVGFGVLLGACLVEEAARPLRVGEVASEARQAKGHFYGGQSVAFDHAPSLSKLCLGLEYKINRLRSLKQA